MTYTQFIAGAVTIQLYVLAIASDAVRDGARMSFANHSCSGSIMDMVT